MKGVLSLVFLKTRAFNVYSQGDHRFCICMRSLRQNLELCFGAAAQGWRAAWPMMVPTVLFRRCSAFQRPVSQSQARAFEASGGSAHAKTHHWPTGWSPGSPDVHFGGGGLPVRHCVLNILGCSCSSSSFSAASLQGFDCGHHRHLSGRHPVFPRSSLLAPPPSPSPRPSFPLLLSFLLLFLLLLLLLL